MLESHIRHFRIITKFIENFINVLLTQQRRIQLNENMQSLFLNKVFTDFLNFIGGTTMHRGQGDIIGNLIRNFNLVNCRIKIVNFVDQRLLFRATVRHFIEKPLHIVFQDSGHVVTDTHVENRAKFALPTEFMPQKVNDNPGFQIFLIGFLDFQFLRPLAVITLILNIDAGLGNLDFVQGLDGFQFDVARTAEPGADDILRHLGMGTGSHTDWRFQFLPKH